jgi:hypothetical protein
MPVQPDEERRIAILRADLLDLGLDWNKQYRLIDEGPRWRLQFIRPITDEQFRQAKRLAESIMNS